MPSIGEIAYCLCIFHFSQGGILETLQVAFLVNENGFTFQYIEIGAQNELYAEVITGLNEGDIVALGIEIEQ